MMLQTLIQLAVTPILNRFLMGNKDKRKFENARTVGFALVLLIIFEFVSFDADSINRSLVYYYYDIGGYFQIYIPRGYDFGSDQSLDYNPWHYGQDVLPFLLTIIAAVLSSYKRILSMRYTLKQGYIRKMKLFVREKIKIIDEAEINLSKVDKSGNLLPRKVSKQAMIIKRFKGVHEANQKKKLI
jgi:hypothetical protein